MWSSCSWIDASPVPPTCRRELAAKRGIAPRAFESATPVSGRERQHDRGAHAARGRRRDHGRATSGCRRARHGFARACRHRDWCELACGCPGSCAPASGCRGSCALGSGSLGSSAPGSGCRVSSAPACGCLGGCALGFVERLGVGAFERSFDPGAPSHRSAAPSLDRYAHSEVARTRSRGAAAPSDRCARRSDRRSSRSARRSRSRRQKDGPAARWWAGAAVPGRRPFHERRTNQCTRGARTPWRAPR